MKTRTAWLVSAFIKLRASARRICKNSIFLPHDACLENFRAFLGEVEWLEVQSKHDFLTRQDWLEVQAAMREDSEPRVVLTGSEFDPRQYSR